MRNSIIAALTAFAFLTTPVYAGDMSFDMNNNFNYTKSSQSYGAGSANSANSANSAGSGGSAGSGTAVWVGLAVVLLIVIGMNASGGGNHGHTYSPS